MLFRSVSQSRYDRVERYCNYVLSIWNDVLKFVTGKIVNKMANDGMEEVRVSALAYMLGYDKRTLDKRGRRIRNIDFLTALRKSNAKYARMEVTHFSNTVMMGYCMRGRRRTFIVTGRLGIYLARGR